MAVLGYYRLSWTWGWGEIPETHFRCLRCFDGSEEWSEIGETPVNFDELPLWSAACCEICDAPLRVKGFYPPMWAS